MDGQPKVKDAPSNNNIPNERDALLGNNNNRQHTYHVSAVGVYLPRHRPAATPFLVPNAVSPNPAHLPLPQNDLGNGAQGDIGVVDSLKALLFSGWINVLLVAVPLSFISHFAKWGSTADFVISFIAIVPLASLLGDSTEQCALKLGQTLGGLMNATFGNAVEAIVGILALTKGELRIVQTSMLGSILSNILLVLGCSFLAAGYKFKESNFQVTAAQASSSLMVLGTTTLVIPAAYHVSRKEVNGDAFAGMLATARDKTNDLNGLLTISRGTAIILLVCYGFYLFFQLKTHAYLFEDPQAHEEEEAKMNVTTAVVSLCVVTVITSFCADYLVGAIDEFADQYKIPKSFIGLILIPIVGNAAEHVTSVWMAMKGKMEITIGVAIGSSIQIAVGVIPLLVVVGWAIGQNLTLYFETFETIILFISIYLVNCLVQDGKSNWLEGMMLVALYAIVALAFW
ncbi:BQ2448_2545 [Microbotryum intermedium]|uniref:Vacuolar calcium ion transporter n=1 Tax=Microbotryum intermedium TaxID=269621 RepID=A0A238F8K3_9BASI|nr:BQ2448_2545 [Microbotryum intermedium]